MKIDHIGIAVRSIDNRIHLWKDILNLDLLYTKEVLNQKVRIAVLECNGVHIELLEALDDHSPIHSFIEKRGEGIHHISIQVADVAQALKKMSMENIRLIDEEPRIGASGKKIAFIHPKDMGGVLVELTE